MAKEPEFWRDSGEGEALCLVGVVLGGLLGDLTNGLTLRTLPCGVCLPPGLALLALGMGGWSFGGESAVSFW